MTKGRLRVLSFFLNNYGRKNFTSYYGTGVGACFIFFLERSLAICLVWQR